MATARKSAKSAAAGKAAGPKRTRAAAPVAPAKPPASSRPAPKATKPKKPKLVRDSFTMPKDEYAVIAALKQRAMGAGRPAKKSEVLRAGVKALAAMGNAAFAAALSAVPAIKTGRPAKP